MNHQHSHLIDPETLMRIKPLELRARVVVEGFFSGLHKSPYHGFSVEFSEYRQYSPGDDPRTLDWRLYARTDRHYVKRFEDETNLRCYLLVDQSRSMGFGSTGYTKSDYAVTAAATLAYFLAYQRDSVGLMTFDEQLVDYVPARFRPGHLHRLLVALERTLSGKSTDLAAPLAQIARTVTKRGLVVLISDLLAPLNELERHLAYLRCRGHEVIVLRILDPVEVSFDLGAAAQIQDLESGRQIYVDPELARDDYLRRFAEHREELQGICGELGVDLYTMPTDRPLERVLFDFLAARLRRGRRFRPRRAAGRPA